MYSLARRLRSYSSAAFRLSSTAWSPPDEGPCWGALRCDAQGDPAVPAVVLDQGEPQGQQGIDRRAGAGIADEHGLESDRGDQFLGQWARAGIGGEEQDGARRRVGEILPAQGRAWKCFALSLIAGRASGTRPVSGRGAAALYQWRGTRGWYSRGMPGPGVGRRSALWPRCDDGDRRRGAALGRAVVPGGRANGRAGKPD